MLMPIAIEGRRRSRAKYSEVGHLAQPAFAKASAPAAKIKQSFISGNHLNLPKIG
jgi:hypothetical protein